jgi:hypothetical protein
MLLLPEISVAGARNNVAAVRISVAVGPDNVAARWTVLFRRGSVLLRKKKQHGSNAKKHCFPTVFATLSVGQPKHPENGPFYGVELLGA